VRRFMKQAIVLAEGLKPTHKTGFFSIKGFKCF
jgi:hypothetical protein